MSINATCRDKYLNFVAQTSCKILGNGLKAVGSCMIPLALAHLCKAATFFTQEKPIFSASFVGTDITEWSESTQNTHAWATTAAIVGCFAAKALNAAGNYVLARAPAVAAKPFDPSKEA